MTTDTIDEGKIGSLPALTNKLLQALRQQQEKLWRLASGDRKRVERML
jgi:hypothetical protein